LAKLSLRFTVSALRLEPDTARTLERLGLKTIGALAGLPRLALARRFRGADNVVDALDRALGRKPEPLTAELRRSAAASHASSWKSRRPHAGSGESRRSSG
jgi:nucleotidyltransferase/DNA polymerase involved in DNA repair